MKKVKLKDSAVAVGRQELVCLQPRQIVHVKSCLLNLGGVGKASSADNQGSVTHHVSVRLGKRSSEKQLHRNALDAAPFGKVHRTVSKDGGQHGGQPAFGGSAHGQYHRVAADGFKVVVDVSVAALQSEDVL